MIGSRQAAVVVALGLLMGMLWAASVSAGQTAGSGDGILLAALFRTRGLIERITADLQKVDRDIRQNETTISKAESLIALARQRDNQRAESAARDALLKAREARAKNEEARARLELSRKRAVASLGAITNRLASGSIDSGPNLRVRGMISSFSGRVQVSKKSGEHFNLTADDVGLLEPGDSVLTYGSSSVEVQTLDGRGTVRLGEYSEIRLQEDTPEKQVLELARGKIYSAVDKADDFAKMLQDRMESYGDDLKTIEGFSEQKGRAAIASIKKWAKRLEVRTPAYVLADRGTKFSTEIKDDGEGDIAVFEGAVEISDVKGEKRVLIGEGFRVIMTKAGISEPQRIVNVDKWWERTGS